MTRAEYGEDPHNLLIPIIENVSHPGAETVSFQGVNRLQIHTLGGNDSVLSDDTLVPTLVEMGTGNDSMTIGTVPLVFDPNLTSPEYPSGIPVADTSTMTNGNSTDLVVHGSDGNDRFEVNHNTAEAFLFGDAGDDTFVINTFLQVVDDTSPRDGDPRLPML